MTNCPACGSVVPEGARFCPSCGRSLAVGAATEERKLATVLFADLAGSTELALTLDAEHLRAFLADFFPSCIRYTSVSVPYHIGNGWGGGLVPIVTTSMYLSSNSVGYALIYPIVVPAVMFLIAVFVMPETRKHSIWEEGAIEAARARA